MKTLESIPKTNPYQVPQGYFEQFPMVIQKRIEFAKPVKDLVPNFSYALKFALPLLLALVITLAILRSKTPTTVERMLSTVSTEQLVAFLEEANLSTDELLNILELSDSELEVIEQEVYKSYRLKPEELNLLLEEPGVEINF